MSKIHNTGSTSGTGNLMYIDPNQQSITDAISSGHGFWNNNSINTGFNSADFLNNVLNGKSDQEQHTYMMELMIKFEGQYEDRGSKLDTYYKIRKLFNALPEDEQSAMVIENKTAIKFVDDPSKELVYTHHVTHEL